MPMGMSVSILHLCVGVVCFHTGVGFLLFI